MHYILVHIILLSHLIFFFFNDTATTEIYTLSLHDALPICTAVSMGHETFGPVAARKEETRHMEFAALSGCDDKNTLAVDDRSEEHTSELQSHVNLVCRLLLEKKKKKNNT